MYNQIATRCPKSRFSTARQYKILVAGIIAAGLLLAGEMTSAHSGGLNSQGCHGGSRPYHCHRAPSEMVGNRLRCDLGSRSRECVGRTSADVLSYQRQLMRHCDSLPDDFADGRNGPATRQALRSFQRAYGLVPDGVYGPRTAEALKGQVNGRCR